MDMEYMIDIQTSNIYKEREMEYMLQLRLQRCTNEITHIEWWQNCLPEVEGGID